MKKRALRKDFFMEIRKSLNRFLSIFLIVALGVAFFAGLQAAAPDMESSGDAYFDENSLMDLKVISTLGLTEDDRKALEALDGVKTAEGAWMTDVLYGEDTSQEVLHVESIAEQFQKLVLSEGTIPTKQGECFVDDELAESLGLSVGDTLKVRESLEEDEDPMLKTDTFTVTGIGSSPMYISFNRGNSTLGSGKVAGILYVVPENFDVDVYTQIWLEAEGARELNTFSEAYTDLTDQVENQVKGIEEVRCQARYEEVLEDATDQLEEGRQKLADARQELEDGKAEADQELSDAKQELDDGEQQLKDGKADLEDAKAEVLDGKEQLESAKAEAADGRAQLESAKIELAEGRAQLESAKAEAADGRAQLESAKTELAGGQEQIKSAKEETAKGWEQLKAAKEQLASSKEELEKGKQELAANQKTLEEKQNELTAAFDQITQGEAQLAAAKEELTAKASQSQFAGSAEELTKAEETLAAAWAELRQKEEELAASRTQAEEGQAQLDDGWEKLSKAQEELDAGEAQIQAAELELAENEKKLEEADSQILAKEEELEKGQAEIEANEIELSKGEAKIAENEAKLNIGESEITANEAKLNSGESEIAENEQKLKDAEEEIAKGESEIAENEQKLADGKKDYEDGKAEADEKIADGEQKIADAESELADAEAKVADIKKPEWTVSVREDSTDYVGYRENAERMANIAKVFPAMFFLVAALISLTTMTRMVEEERTQIGTLKALGYGKASIAMKYLLYALLATLGGSIAGALFGQKFLPFVIIQAYGIIYQHMNVCLTPYQAGSAGLALGLAVVCTTAAAMAACYKELAGDPAELMRPPAPKEGKRVWLERIGFLWKHLSFSWKSTVRNLFRYKKRFLMTIFGIGGCMALLLVGFGLRDSIMDVAVLQYQEIQLYDGMIIEKDDASAEEIQQLEETVRSNAHVTDQKEVYMKNLTMKHEKNHREVYLMVPDTTEDFDHFVLLRDRKTKETYQLDDTGIVLAEKTAKLLGVEKGDTIEIDRGDGTTVSVPVSNVCENYMMHYAYLSPNLYEEIFGEPAVYNNLIFITDQDSEEEIEQTGAEFMTEEAALSVSYMGSVKQRVDDMLTSLDSVIYVLIISAGLLAFVVVYNLNNININERRRELATLKVLGFYDKEVDAYVYRENILLTLIGAVLGIFLGFLLHRYVILTVEVDECMFGRNIKPLSDLYAFVLTCLFSAAVNGAMHFKLKKIDMVESLKSME